MMRKMNRKKEIESFIQHFNKTKEKESILSYCILCGEQFPDLRIKHGLLHDMSKHPGYFELQTGLKPKEIVNFENS